MEIDPGRLEVALVELKNMLKDGLLASDIWDRQTGLRLAAYNSRPDKVNSHPNAAALLTEIVRMIDGHLETSGMPPFNSYFFLELTHNRAGMVIRHGNQVLQGILLDSSKTNIGVLMAVAVPRLLQRVNGG